MIFQFPNGTTLEKPFWGKFVGLMRDNLRPTSVVFTTKDFKDMWDLPVHCPAATEVGQQLDRIHKALK